MLKLFPKKWFKCANCSGIWMKKWSDEECAKEYEQNFPNDPNMEFPIDIICDGCYKEFKPWLDNLTQNKRDELEIEQCLEIPIEFEEDLEKLTEKFAERFFEIFTTQFSPTKEEYQDDLTKNK